MECLIIEIRSEPYKMGDFWYLDVKYQSWGVIGFTKVSFNSEDSAYDCQIKQKFRKDDNHKVTML